MSDREKLEQVIAVLSRQLQANAQERVVTLALLDEFEELLEVISSEVPIQSPKRGRVCRLSGVWMKAFLSIGLNRPECSRSELITPAIFVPA